MKARQAKKMINNGTAYFAHAGWVCDSAAVKGKKVFDLFTGEVYGDITDGSVVRSIWIRGQEGKRAHKGWTAQCDLYNEYWEGIN